MTEETFVRCMAILQEAFPKRAFNAKIYFSCLKDLADDAFERSVLRIAQSRPTLYPDDNLIAILREQIEGNAKDRSELAWEDAIRAVKEHGYYESVSFEDKIINGVVRAMGGWEQFSSMLIEEEPFRKRDFTALYQAYSSSGRDCPEKLVGFHERTNGAEKKQPAMIACDYLPEKRKQIEVK